VRIKNRENGSERIVRTDESWAWMELKLVVKGHWGNASIVTLRLITRTPLSMTQCFVMGVIMKLGSYALPPPAPMRLYKSTTAGASRRRENYWIVTELGHFLYENIYSIMTLSISSAMQEVFQTGDDSILIADDGFVQQLVTWHACELLAVMTSLEFFVLSIRVVFF